MKILFRVFLMSTAIPLSPVVAQRLPLENGGFEWHSPCAWEARSDGGNIVLVERLRGTGGNDSCSFAVLQQRDAAGTNLTRITQLTPDVTLSASQWVRVDFDARIHDVNHHNATHVRIKLVGGSEVRRQIPATSGHWESFHTGVTAGVLFNGDVEITFEICASQATQVVTLSVDNVRLRRVGFDPGDNLDNDVPCLFDQLVEVSWSNDDPADCCLADIAPFDDGDVFQDDVVGIGDLLQVLKEWSPDATTCSHADIEYPTFDDKVTFADVLVVIGNWGACPGTSATEPPSLEDELDCMGLTEEQWDDIEDCLSNATSADDDNCICWFEHYYYCHCAGSCPGFVNCPGLDPFATHPH